MTKRKTVTAPAAVIEPPPKSPRAASKLAAMIAALRGDDGATIADLQALTGWQEHSIRGALAGALKKKFALAIVSEKVERGRVYRVAEKGAQA
jgi:hypothetical protein